MTKRQETLIGAGAMMLFSAGAFGAEDWSKPYSAPCVERPPLRRDLAPGAPGAGENVFEFTVRSERRAV